MACSMPGEGMWVWEMELDDGSSSGNGNGNGRDRDGVIQGGKGDTRPRRSRPDEQRIVSNPVLLAMVRCRER